LRGTIPWYYLFVLLGVGGIVLVTLGASYERRRRNLARIRGAFRTLT
jgi:hypothetical protein